MMLRTGFILLLAFAPQHSIALDRVYVHQLR